MEKNLSHGLLSFRIPFLMLHFENVTHSLINWDQKMQQPNDSMIPPSCSRTTNPPTTLVNPLDADDPILQIMAGC